MRPTPLIAFVLGATMTVVAGSAGPGAATVATPNEARCNNTTSVKGVTAAFNQFLAAPGTAKKIRLVDQGTKIRDSVDKYARATSVSGTTKPGQQTLVTSVQVTCTGKATADFTFDLQFKDTATNTTTPPIGTHETGDAVLKRGVWFVSGASVCRYLALDLDPAAKPSIQECYQALGLQVPTS